MIDAKHTYFTFCLKLNHQSNLAMKKVLLSIIVVFSLQSQVKAQDTVYIIREIIRETQTIKKEKLRLGKDVIPEKRNEISLVAGYAPYFIYNQGNENQYFGSYGFRYTRYINERYSTGFTASYLRTSDDYYYYTDYNGADNERLGNHFFIAMGHFNLNYYNKKNITLYMGASVGIMTIARNEVDYVYDFITQDYDYIKRRDHLTIPVADFTAFGIRMHHKTFSPFFEVGVGLEGFFRGGLSVRF